MLVVVVAGGRVVVVVGAVRGAWVTGGATYTGVGCVVGGVVEWVTRGVVVVVALVVVVVGVSASGVGALLFVATTMPTPTPSARTAVPIHARMLESRLISDPLHTFPVSPQLLRHRDARRAQVALFKTTVAHARRPLHLCSNIDREMYKTLEIPTSEL